MPLKITVNRAVLDSVAGLLKQAGNTADRVSEAAGLMLSWRVRARLIFGLVDSHGYLDLFEIKKPETRLLAASQDRGNHYWHADAVKAIVQAEKYLHNASQNALTLAEGVRRERQLDVRVIRPRAVVIMGHSAQLDTPSKKDDFRVLRTSLRHIEIILYDELLTSLKN